MQHDIAERIRCRSLENRFTTADEASRLIKDGDVVLASGFTPSGYPKAVPLALAERIRKTGERLSITLITGASVGDELDGALTRAGAIAKRIPYQTNASSRTAINEGRTFFIDDHLSQISGRTRRGVYGKPDLAIVEAVMITEDGKIVPSTSVGNTPVFLNEAPRIIIEINTSQPLGLYGMHDIYIPQRQPYCDVIRILKPEDRIGSPAMDCDPDKIAAVVVTDIKDSSRALAPGDDATARIASHVVDFLHNEVKEGRLPPNLLPLQSGVGSIANSVLAGLMDSPFTGMTFFSEVIQDAVLDLLDAGKFRVASGTSLSLSPERLDGFYQGLDRYRDKVILRPQEVSNNPEIIRRLGSIAMNTAIEMNIVR
jgi:succinyl-CoA:acetate CoA-transferase